MTADERFMQMAIALAGLGRGQTTPNPLVGAIVVRDGVIIGQGAHLRAGGPHAEVHALRMAGEAAKGATIYVTLEPCNHYGRTPPCTEAIIEAGIKRVVVASVDHDPRTAQQGLARLREAGIEVTASVLAKEADALNRDFFYRVDTGRPRVIYKVAMTASGHTAASNGHSQYVTGEAALRDVQSLRRAHPGIAVGVQTVIADNPRLTVRDDDSASASLQPMRIVFDSQLRTPSSAQLLYEPGHTLILATAAGIQAKEDVARQWQAGGSRQAGSQGQADNAIEVVEVPGHQGRVDLPQALQILGQRGLNSMLLEGGSTLAAAFFAQQLIDEVYVYIAPKMLCAGLPALAGQWTNSMDEAVHLENTTWCQIGNDMRLNATVRYTVRG